MLKTRLKTRSKIKTLPQCFLTISLFILFINASARPLYGQHHGMGPKPGRYLGYIKPDGYNKKIPTTLDLIIIQEGSDYTNFKGIVKLALGGHSSTEYIAHHFPKVSYSFARSELIFNQDMQDFSIFSAKVHMMDGKLMIMGKFQSIRGDISGSLQLIHIEDSNEFNTDLDLNPLFSDSESVDTLTGVYLGRCDGKKTQLQLEASKWAGSSGLSRNPLAGYKIKGRWATKNGTCGTIEKYCQENHFNSGYYNFYNGRLKLEGHPLNKTCIITKRTNNESTISCENSCTLKKEPKTGNSVDRNGTFHSYKRKHKIDISSDEPLPEIPTPSDLSGTFKGYLHHELNNRYQPLRIIINAYKYADRPNRPEVLYVSAKPSLYFKEFAAQESIAYKIDQRPFLNTMPYFTFIGPGEVYFQINSWTKKSIIGTWYSVNFGRVGTFELQKESIIDDDIPEPISIMPPIQNKYKNQNWEVSLTTFFKENDEDIDETDFFPATINGSAIFMPSGVIKHISAGSYDFYTNSLSILVGEDQIAVGTVDDNSISIYIPNVSSWGTILKPHLREKFIKSAAP
ncbi:MAG: hypothetical protein R3B45_18025 [Bdellovibrionota bacterium]